MQSINKNKYLEDQCNELSVLLNTTRECKKNRNNTILPQPIPRKRQNTIRKHVNKLTYYLQSKTMFK